MPADLIHDTPVAVLNLVVSGDNSLIRDPSCAALLCWDAQLGATCTYDVLHRLRKKKCKWLRSKIQHLLPAGAVSQCIVRGLKAKTRYEFRVRSKSGDSSGPYSQVVYHKTAAPIQLQNRTNMHHRSNESVPQTKTATLSPQEATIISAESLEVKPVKKKRKIEQNQSTIQESANIHIFKNDEVELETTILKNDEVALETAINAATDLSRGVALCLFCGEIADALFSCGHLTSCQQCCSVKIQLHDSRCCICFNTVDSISLLELKKGNSVACALRLKGCSHIREVALPCGCYKYCDNCASSMIMCVEHKRRLVPGESIKVFDQAGFIRAD